MSARPTPISSSAVPIPNGPGAAAILSAGIGSCALGIIAVLADKLPPVARLLTIYKPTGPLSGVTTAAILIWLIAWALLHWSWRGRNVALGRVNAISLVLLGMALLLTFPPVADLF